MVPHGPYISKYLDPPGTYISELYWNKWNPSEIFGPP